ncbi:SpoIVB peptidase [Clostridium perfringens]|uniref:SpoIVB peptidase n=1 Tax=Clostridium perfringens TaxID=1502 RepID=UPI0011248141|nr:SpoIVB peptidase [Clostridium perfringens]DAP32160.1 MAG TPA: stage IV sporulation protein B [Caudoviricetes sp.]MCH1963448.1 SpoIVB peptidase [Clostridium perfringens]MDK0625705.1 SpoIVB peptidase [Clostridium perfringens]MDK0663557.1 SpoIVB peptidase [Clostridium perfringens]MDK0735464.1 SpoIVB peptidase [Clostridium perfringens]
MKNMNKRIKIISIIMISLILLLSSVTFAKDYCESNNVFASSNFYSLNSKSSNDEKFKNRYGVALVNSEQEKRDIELYAGGNSVGVRVSTDGVLAVGYSDLTKGNVEIASPAQNGGIQIGDRLISVNGNKIKNSKDLSKKINESKSENVEILLERNGEEITKNIKLSKNQDGDYKIGLWVRDSTAGVGTLTFYDKESGKYGAIGHPITDSETEKILSIKNGDLLNSSIISIKKGVKGNPGELRGIFSSDKKPIGNVTGNTQCGIFGSMNTENLKNINNKTYKVGWRDEIQPGPAQIITTIDEEGPKLYDIEIVKLTKQESISTKSMVIKITDERLLEKTGGVVQGMSGSPIIQNDKIIGAVTHVLVNKPEIGYGIYIEWMLKDAKII